MLWGERSLLAKPYDLSKPLVALEHDTTLIAVAEMSGTSWLALAIVPGVDRRPLETAEMPVHESVIAQSTRPPGGGTQTAGDGRRDTRRSGAENRVRRAEGIFGPIEPG